MVLNVDTERSVEKILARQKRITWVLGLLTVAVLVLVILMVIEHRPSTFGRGHTSIFEAIIFDAAEENQPADVARLFPINTSNTALQWKETDAEKWLSVVAWMKASDYQSYYQPLQQSGETGSIPSGVNLWVTAVPQVKDFCQSLNFQDKSFRIKQYLGLDPNRAYGLFVELWVKSEDLFRPCPDPEIDDSVCETTFNRREPPTVKNIADYGRFFDQLVKSSYTASGAPWTRLGYTYDWKNSRRNIGASEYILVPEGRYRVAAAYSTHEYCK